MWFKNGGGNGEIRSLCRSLGLLCIYFQIFCLPIKYWVGKHSSTQKFFFATFFAFGSSSKNFIFEFFCFSSEIIFNKCSVFSVVFGWFFNLYFKADAKIGTFFAEFRIIMKLDGKIWSLLRELEIILKDEEGIRSLFKVAPDIGPWLVLMLKLDERIW